jgi:disulfide bond formation protein DsbB
MLARVLEPARACLLLALVSAALLLGALALQYLGGFQPCRLCVWQRWPYLALIALGLIGWRWRPRVALGVATLVLLGGAGLAAYHVGIEQGWWALPASCVAGGTAATVEELKRMLAEAPPACDQVSFAFLGLTLAGWNLAISVLLATFTVACGFVQRGGAARLDPMTADRARQISAGSAPRPRSGSRW